MNRMKAETKRINVYMPKKFESYEEYTSKLVELLEAEDQVESLREEIHGEAHIPFEFKQVLEERNFLEMNIPSSYHDKIKLDGLV